MKRMRKKLLIILLVFCALTPAVQADTRFLLDYFLFKPYGQFGDEFASSFYYGVKFRQSLFWILSLQLSGGSGSSSTGLGELYFLVRDTPLEGKRVNVRVMPLTFTLCLSSQESVIKPYICIGPGFYKMSSDLSQEGLTTLIDIWDGDELVPAPPVINYDHELGAMIDAEEIGEINKAEWPTFSGSGIGMVYGFGLWVFTESRTEIGFNFTLHRPKINLGEVRFDAGSGEWVPCESTFNLLLMTLTVGKGF